MKQPREIYLDYAAATPLAVAVREAMEPYLERDFYNPSAPYLAARNVRGDLEEARSGVAKIIGGRPAEVVFTSGATESNNLAVRGVREAFPKGKILVSAIEHESVLAPAAAAGAQLIPVKKDGLVDLVALKKLLKADTVLVSLGLVNNEIGVLQPLGEVSRLVKAECLRRLKKGEKTPIYLHSDAAQAANFVDLHVSRLGVDLLSLNGAKIYGPKQTGILYVRAGTKLAPQIRGGGQEWGLRSGTENVAGAIGFAKALAMAQSARKQEAERLTRLRRAMEQALAEVSAAVKLNGSVKHRAPHIISVLFAGCDNERLMMELDERGVLVATGSACSASQDESSHVLKAIGLSDADARSTIRFSLGRGTSQKDIDRVVALLKKLLTA